MTSRRLPDPPRHIDLDLINYINDLVRSVEISFQEAFAQTLKDIQDVNVSAPANNHVLTYNASTKKWVPASVSAAGGAVTSVGGLLEVSAPSPANNTVLTYSSGQWIAASVSATGGSPPNLWATISSDNGSTTADSTADNLAVRGGTGIKTSVTGDVLTILVSADYITSASASSLTQSIINAGQYITSASTSALIQSFNYLTSASASVQYASVGHSHAGFITVSSDDGSTTANVAGDVLDVRGGTGVRTSVTGDVLTILLSATGISAGTYGTSTIIPQFIVNAQGQITSVVRVTAPAAAGGGLVVRTTAVLLQVSNQVSTSTGVNTGAIAVSIPGGNKFFTFQSRIIYQSHVSTDFNFIVSANASAISGSFGYFNVSNTSFGVHQTVSFNTTVSVATCVNTTRQLYLQGSLYSISGGTVQLKWGTPLSAATAGGVPLIVFGTSYMKLEELADQN